MKLRIGRTFLLIGLVTLAAVHPWPTAAAAQAALEGFPRVVSALKATPGCLGVETGQTSSGKRVIFAWFENKKALVGWYHSDVHQRAMKSVFPNQTFDRQPLPDLAEDSGPILAIVSVKPADSARPDSTSLPIASIGIELYGPLPGGVAVGGRFAPEGLKVRGLREIDLGTAQGQPR
jgi:heme-degrading monooxygenase HmoA